MQKRITCLSMPIVEGLFGLSAASRFKQVVGIEISGKAF